MTFMPTLRRLPLALVMAGAFAVSGVSAAQAQQEFSPEHLSVAQEYVEMTDRGNVYETTLVELGVSVMRLLVQQNPDLIDPLPQAVQKVVDEYVANKDQVFSLFARIYANRFTQEEMQEIVDFYNTDTGQKLLASNAGINREMQRVLGVWESNARSEFLSRVRAELRAAGHNV